MNHRLNRFIAAALIGSAVSLAGCYTLLRHPPTDDGYEHVDFAECTVCHEDYYHFTRWDPLYPDVWWDYYAVPWWYGDVIVIDADEEMPAFRSIRDKDAQLRDGTGSGGAVVIKRRPYGGASDTSGSERGAVGNAADERPGEKIKRKEAPSKRTSNDEKDDAGDAVKERPQKEKSESEGTDSSGEKRKEKRKES